MTVHRVQGQTMPSMIVDLESCKGTEAAYIMLSQASSIDGVAIFRLFSQKRIQCAMSQD
ncbi:hypothetical protein J132_06618 [Termitomyces sp. J132]|nr:hypothetical protein J132_06618 [Termitomyces sp. J132]